MCSPSTIRRRSSRAAEARPTGTSKYEVTGPDAARFIQRRFTNDLAGLGVGGVRYGVFVNADGVMVDDGNVYKHSDDKFWLMINTADLQGWFQETAGGLAATIEHRTEDLPMISVQGPGSRSLLEGITEGPLSELKYFRCWPGPGESGRRGRLGSADRFLRRDRLRARDRPWIRQHPVGGADRGGRHAVRPRGDRHRAH